MDLKQISDMLLSGDLPGVTAGAIFLLLTFWKKIKPSVWDRIPKRWQWSIPLALGVLSAVGASLANGDPWEKALSAGLLGALEGFIAMGVHHSLKTGSSSSEPPSGATSGSLPLVLIFSSLWASACAAPCQAAMVLSAYEAESSQCVKLFSTETEARACLAEVQLRYAPKLVEIGEEAKEALDNAEGKKGLDK